MKKRDKKGIMIDEVADFTTIPKWFTEFIKPLKKKKIFICWSRNYGKSSFYKFWKEHNYAKTK